MKTNLTESKPNFLKEAGKETTRHLGFFFDPQKSSKRAPLGAWPKFEKYKVYPNFDGSLNSTPSGKTFQPAIQEEEFGSPGEIGPPRESTPHKKMNNC